MRHHYQHPASIDLGFTRIEATLDVTYLFDAGNDGALHIISAGITQDGVRSALSMDNALLNDESLCLVLIAHAKDSEQTLAA